MIECFFFIERIDENEDDGTVRAICVDCRRNLPKDFPSWFYNGDVGPWTLTCRNCNKVIHLHKEENETESAV
jgi:hypothetical protein